MRIRKIGLLAIQTLISKMKGALPLIMIFLGGCALPSTESYDLIFRNVTIVDVASCSIQERKDVVVEGGKIIYVWDYDAERHTSADEKIDGEGKFLIPGLWDMHVHTQDSSYLNMFLNFGITGVRDMGGCVPEATDGCESLCPERLITWKALIETGKILGPAMFIAGPVLSGTGWATSLPARTIGEVRTSFSTLVQMNVDFVKVYEQIPPEVYREIAALSRENGLPFCGHISESMLLSEVSDLGQLSIEHLREQLVLCFTEDPDELELFLQEDNYTEEDRAFVKPWIADAPKALASFQKNNTWIVPTLAVQFARQRYADSLWINHALRKRLPESVNAGMLDHVNRMQGLSSKDKKSDLLWWSAQKKLVKRLHQLGIGLLAGSDIACEGGIPGYSLHEELQLLTECGLTPGEALQTATINPAKFLGLTHQGQIKESFAADMILLQSNPLESIRNTLGICAVIRNGQVLPGEKGGDYSPRCTSASGDGQVR